MHRTGIFLSFLFCCLWAEAQEVVLPPDTAYMLEEVVATGRKYQFATGHHRQQIDSMELLALSGNNLSDLLSRNAAIFLKSYGPGNISTPSFRGTSAAHTAVLWNGMNLQNPLTGMFDLSLFPLFFADDVSLQYGGSGTLYGSGAVGGSIHLNNTACFNCGNSARAYLGAGSFSDFRQGAQLSLSRKNINSKLKFFNQSAQNNFQYHNTALAGSPLTEQHNAALNQWGIMNDNYFKAGEKNLLSLRFWYNENQRQNPPTMLVLKSESEVFTWSARGMAAWERNAQKYKLELRSAFFYDYIDYSDPFTSLFAEHINHSFLNEAEVNLPIGKQLLLNTGLSSHFHTGISDYFPQVQQQNRISAFSSLKWTNRENTLHTTASLRQEWVKDLIAPLVPSMGINFLANPRILLSANISGVYRLPGFNDLYWVPGGNPKLKPEKGWNMEAGIAFNERYLPYTDNLKFTIFSNLIENWIIWMPGSPIWVPENVQEVWARGIESSYNYKVTAGNIKFNFDASANYVLSTNMKAVFANDQSVGKQLIYVPKLSAIAGMGAEIGKYNLGYRHTYTGERFTSSDNTESLPAFTTGNLQLGRNIKSAWFSANLNLHINNLWNTPYQVMIWRPMPGRNYLLSIILDLNHKNK